MDKIEDLNIYYVERIAQVNNNASAIQRQIIQNDIVLATQIVVKRDNAEHHRFYVNGHCDLLSIDSNKDEAVSEIFYWNNTIIWFHQGTNFAEVGKWKLGTRKSSEKRTLPLNLRPKAVHNVKFCEKGLFLFPITSEFDSTLMAFLYNPNKPIPDSMSKINIFEYNEIEKEFKDPYLEQKGIQKKYVFKDHDLKKYFQQ